MEIKAIPGSLKLKGKKKDPKKTTGGSTGGVNKRDTRTEAQKRFETIKRLREEKEILNVASRSHAQRIEDMNTHLSRLSEHNEMPKIGPG